MTDKNINKKEKAKLALPTEAVITRVSVKDDKKITKKTVTSTTNKTTKKGKPLKGIAGYFKGAWQELKQVRWPNRRTTWKLTAAVIIFTALFIAIIVLLDIGFDLLLNKIS
jgi:preprotein translocase subunit SecE